MASHEHCSIKRALPIQVLIMLKQRQIERTTSMPSELGAQLVSVIVPTYCESENLKELATRIDTAIASLYRYELIVVDDDSPDTTFEVCKVLSANFPFRLEVRKNARGLSSAAVYGMERAAGEIIVVMDADLSHPPESLPKLVKTLLESDADFVVGSRYCQGGRIAEEWKQTRRLRSRVATWLAAPLVRIHDPMAGFFALRRSTLSRAGRLNLVGFKIGLELMVRCRCSRIVEIPIDFRERKFGTSKLTWVVQWHYMSQLIRLYLFRITVGLRSWLGQSQV